MLIRNLEAHNSIANQFLSELRSTTIQNDRLRFRLNLSRLGEIMAYEISKDLNYKTTEIITSLGKKVMQTPSSEVVLITMLRAGLPFLEGFQRIFDNADTGLHRFIQGGRKFRDKDFIRLLCGSTTDGENGYLVRSDAGHGPVRSECFAGPRQTRPTKANSFRLCYCRTRRCRLSEEKYSATRFSMDFLNR